MDLRLSTEGIHPLVLPIGFVQLIGREHQILLGDQFGLLFFNDSQLLGGEFFLKTDTVGHQFVDTTIHQFCMSSRHLRSRYLLLRCFGLHHTRHECRTTYQ